ncbi:MAG: translocase [Planctomycetes bacterium]|nr:translocase [Planctomycetota bacterium]
MNSNPHHQRRAKSIWPEWWQRRKWELVVRRVMAISNALTDIPNDELQQRARHCHYLVQRSDFEEHVIVEVFALVREIAGRVHWLRHHPVQILGALAMSQGWIAEMRTGEGKTLTSLMTMTLFALKGRGCHVFTANEYLAERDCDFAKPVLDWFGLTAAVLLPQTQSAKRTDCYRADITFGSEKDFGFDFLRDRLATLSDSDPVETIQRGHAYAIVDEADCILIDQASTPLIISSPQPPSAADLELFHWSERFAGSLIGTNDYALDPRQQSARLTLRGCRKLRLSGKPDLVCQLSAEAIFSQVERAIAARHFFRESQEYIVIDQRVEVIDHGTGRLLPGRKWRDGLQQAIEIQAGLQPSDSTGSAARITLQSYLQKYHFLCGMTGTAAEARGELQQIYGLPVMPIACHQPCLHQQATPRIFVTHSHKWSALMTDLEQIAASGRSVLVGTTSILSSERCADHLRARGLDVQILHAKQHREESEIIRRAGQPGRITVATNMAGRGTDIQLHPDVRAAGGLHVVLTEMNRSARIDRQLAGRAARQGDPGSSQVFVSLDDEMLSILGSRQVERLQRRAQSFLNGELSRHWISWFQLAQRRFERRGEHERRQLLLHEHHQREMLSSLGLDPTIELPVD